MEKYKLKRHRDTKHSEHKNKSATFFKQQTRQYALQQQRFEQLMVARSDQPLVITSLKNSCPYVSKEAIYLGRKRRKTLSGDSSAGDSWRSHGCDQSPKAGIV